LLSRFRCNRETSPIVLGGIDRFISFTLTLLNLLQSVEQVRFRNL